jgi:PAS domain S-box-containing protein
MTAADTSTHVLVVPEEGLDALADALRDVAGVTVTVATTAPDARERAGDAAVDGVVVGQDLPDDDGVSLVADLSDRDGEWPIVMVTACSDGQVASDALAAGVVDYVQVTTATVDDEATLRRVVDAVTATSERERETVTTARERVQERSAATRGQTRDREIEEYETILETIPVGVFVLDEDADILRVNQKATELVGLDRETGLQMSVPDLVADGIYGEDVMEPYTQLVQELLSASNEKTEGSFQFTAYPNGEERIYEATLTLRPADEEFRGTIGVFRDITERLARQDRLETQRAQLADRTAQLERQNERLDEFASMVSHELRNPLNTAQGHLKLGRRKDDDEYFETAAGALDRMEAMIDDILTLTRQGKTVTDTEPVALDAVVRRSWQAIDAPRATLHNDLEATILADPVRIRQLFENLFRNAVEHGGTDVTIQVGPLPEGAPETAPIEGFFVADDGPGIPEADRGTVFEKGFTTAPGGTGFGLSIVGSVAEAHGWRVEITESTVGTHTGTADGGQPGPDGESTGNRRERGGGARFEITGVRTPESTAANDDAPDSQ